jgi:hypothetical protein
VATNSGEGSRQGSGEGSVYPNIWVCHYFGCYFAAQDVAIFLYYNYALEQQQTTAHFLLHTSRANGIESLGKKKDIGLPKGNTSLFNN